MMFFSIKGFGINKFKLDESVLSHVKKGENTPSFLIMPYLWAFFKISRKSDDFIVRSQRKK